MSRFKAWKMPTLFHGKLTKWNWVVLHPEHLTLGKRTDIGAFTLLAAHAGIIIEDDVQIGSHVSIYSISTIDAKKGSVTIRKGAKIGSHSTIMPGITIGEDAVVGAHSFVNKDVPARTVVVGVPARALQRKTKK